MRKKHNEEKKTIQWGETIKLNILKQTSINEHILHDTVFNWGKENWCPLILTESVSLLTHSCVRWRDNIITKYDVSTKAQYSHSPTRPDPTTAVASRGRILNDSRLLADGKLVVWTCSEHLSNLT